MTPQTTKPRPGRNAALENTHADYIKNFPAYGRQIDEIRKRGLIPNRRVIICFDWSIGTLYPRIVIMRENPPERLEFCYLGGLHLQIVFYDCDRSYLPALIDELMRVKPASVALFNMDAVRRGAPAFTMIHKLEISI